MARGYTRANLTATGVYVSQANAAGIEFTLVRGADIGGLWASRTKLTSSNESQGETNSFAKCVA
jgi:hypothetical protein